MYDEQYDESWQDLQRQIARKIGRKGPTISEIEATSGIVGPMERLVLSAKVDATVADVPTAKDWLHLCYNGPSKGQPDNGWKST
jgi:hypothetical protein